MLIKQIDSKIVANDNKLNLAFDIGKDKLDMYTEINNLSYQDSFPNQTMIIKQKLSCLLKLAEKSGYNGLRVIAEPTGIYHRTLFNLTRKIGHCTAIVNPESVHKFKVIESNDTGKTDTKDCRVIFLLAKYDKILIDRDIKDEYKTLRQFNTHYTDLEKSYVALRCKIYAIREVLFPDYPMSNEFLYSNSGRALVDKYSLNPYKIVKYGYKHFFWRMKKIVPRIRKSTIEKIFNNAKISVSLQPSPEFLRAIETQFSFLWEEYLAIETRKNFVKKQMENIFDKLSAADPKLPFPLKGFITKFSIAQLLAETGPLSDFKSFNQLYRYAGLNIRERQSGQYKGQNKISKKGRSNLRRVLGYITLPLVKKKALYGKYYHSKRNNAMPGNKAMVAVMRKLLKTFWGWYNTNEKFDINRIFIDKYQYKKMKDSVNLNGFIDTGNLMTASVS